jgi:Avidin family
MAMRRTVVLAATLLALGGAALAENHPGETVPFGAPGQWIADDGSIVALQFAPGGLVTGTFISHTPGFACAGTAFPVTGWALSEVVTFSVAWNNDFQNCNAVTNWTGYSLEEPDGVHIATNWSLAHWGGTESAAIESGQTLFRPLAKVESESPVK